MVAAGDRCGSGALEFERAVQPREVVSSVDGWPAVEACVGPALVVVREPVWQGVVEVEKRKGHLPILPPPVGLGEQPASHTHRLACAMNNDT